MDIFQNGQELRIGAAGDTYKEHHWKELQSICNKNRTELFGTDDEVLKKHEEKEKENARTGTGNKRGRSNRKGTSNWKDSNDEGNERCKSSLKDSTALTILKARRNAAKDLVGIMKEQYWPQHLDYVNLWCVLFRK